MANQIRLAYSTSGRTLWNSESSQDNGIRVASDVKVVLKQTNDNKTTTDYYEGYDALVAVLEDLNELENDKNEYYFGAVIEDGRATSVIIVDNAEDGYNGPNGGNNSDVKALSSQNNAGASGAKIELTANATKDTTYEVELQMMNNEGDWKTVDTIDVVVKAGTNYGFTAITGISANQQYRLVCGDLTALLSK